MGRRRVGLLVGLLALVTGACAATPHVTYDGAGDPRPQTAILTPDGFDTYSFTSGPGYSQFEARADNRDGNLRQAFWPADGPYVVDQQSCATWTAATGGDTQQGALLRLSTASGHVQAITVTKNILFFAQWIFNVHVWDTSSLQPFTLVGQIDLRTVFFAGDLPPLPWHLCARVIGGTVDLKAWPAPEGEPAWGDGVHGGSVALPPGWVYPGAAGWYIGHLGAGDFARFDDLRTWTYTFDPVPGFEAPAQRSSSPGQLSTVALG